MVPVCVHIAELTSKILNRNSFLSPGCLRNHVSLEQCKMFTMKHQTTQKSPGVEFCYKLVTQTIFIKRFA